jgi:hypothetical protein
MMEGDRLLRAGDVKAAAGSYSRPRKPRRLSLCIK